MQNLGLSLLIFPLKRKPRMLAMFAHVENAKETGFLSGSRTMKTNSLHPGPAPSLPEQAEGTDPLYSIQEQSETPPARPTGAVTTCLNYHHQQGKGKRGLTVVGLPLSPTCLPLPRHLVPPAPKMCTREGAHLLWSPLWLSPTHLAVTCCVAMRAQPCTCPALHQRALHLCRGLRQEAHQRLRVYLSHRWSSRTPFPAMFCWLFSSRTFYPLLVICFLYLLSYKK